MPENKVLSEANAAPEPLLPIEKKLIGWSRGLGITLLIVLVLINYLVPLKI